MGEVGAFLRIERVNNPRCLIDPPSALSPNL